MASKSNEIKAGIIVFSGIIALIIFIAVITGTRLWQPEKEYYILLRFAGGIEPGVPVRYGGIDVGEVNDIKIYEEDNSIIKITITVKENVPVKYDSEAYINSLGMLSNYYIEITTGSNNSDELPPGSQIPNKEIPMMSELYNDLKNIGEKTQEALGKINDILLTVDFEKVSHVLTNIDENISKSSKGVNSTIENLYHASEQLGVLIENIDEILNKNSGNLDNVFSNLNEAVNNTIELTAQMTSTLNTLNQTVLVSSKDVSETMENLLDVSNNLRDFSSTIRNRPWIIMRKSYEKESKKEK